eukprot:231460-Alexandrium_andersonii.AAC.1
MRALTPSASPVASASLDAIAVIHLSIVARGKARGITDMLHGQMILEQGEISEILPTDATCQIIQYMQLSWHITPTRRTTCATHNKLPNVTPRLLVTQRPRGRDNKPRVKAGRGNKPRAKAGRDNKPRAKAGRDNKPRAEAKRDNKPRAKACLT